jgi:colicin import membrane protein
MQPEVVARTLSNVEDEWKAQAAVFAECNGTSGLEGATIVNCADAPNSFDKSCGTVVSAIVSGAGGDRDVAKEYMADVCSQKIISGWHMQQCHALAVAVQGGMTADKYENRMSFNSAKLCSAFWSHFLADEQARMAKEQAEHEAAEKKAAEEADEKDRLYQEELKKEAERKKAEEAARQKQEAEAKAAEAKAKAAEAAARAAQKKVEAEEVAQVAKVKLAEAEKAQEEHKKAVANADVESKPEPVAAVKKEPVVASKPEPVSPPKVETVAHKEEAPAKPASAEPVSVAKPVAVKPDRAKEAPAVPKPDAKVPPQTSQAKAAP